MTTEQINAVVFKDQAGDYFLLPQQVLERGRVSEEGRALIEEQFPALQAIGTDDDVQGHAAFVLGAVAGAGATILGFGCGVALMRGDDLGPLIQATAAQFESQL